MYGLLKDIERAKDEAEAAEKPRIQLKIDAQWAEIVPVEKEYFQLLVKQDVPEPVAEVVVAELIDEIELLMRPTLQGVETQQLLAQILAELRKQGTPASTKLKMAIPIIPNWVTYEIEGDTEAVVRRLFPMFVRLCEGIRSIAGGDVPGK
ncbi:MAG: hypothetical protein HC857_02450 [Synechococcales cyanobacterium RU_4_20]|nr:hypothetical protein [Synechococcales cyanobacterium RU_4_20]